MDRALDAAQRFEPERRGLRQYRKDLRAGECSDVMWLHALAAAEHGDFGTAAAIAETSLELGASNPQTEASRRGARAEWLRTKKGQLSIYRSDQNLREPQWHSTFPLHSRQLQA
jgi:hypothetical protein